MRGFSQKSTMITLKELHLLINHLHQANEIFDAEAVIEERKHYPSPVAKNDRRAGHVPRSVTLHHKADMVQDLEKKLLQECDQALVALEENTIYLARELIAESVYPWLHRKEPPQSYIDEVMNDETFTPFAQGLAEKRRKLLTSGAHLLLLPLEIEEELRTHIQTIKKKDVTVTLGDILSIGQKNFPSLFTTNSDYWAEVLTFRCYTLGVLEKGMVTKKKVERSFVETR